MPFLAFLFLFLVSFLTEGDNGEGNNQSEQTTEEIREEIEEQRELTYATLDALNELSISVDARFTELREFIEGKLGEVTTRIEGTNGTTSTGETQETIQETQPESRHFWFRRIRE